MRNEFQCSSAGKDCDLVTVKPGSVPAELWETFCNKIIMIKRTSRFNVNIKVGFTRLPQRHLFRICREHFVIMVSNRKDFFTSAMTSTCKNNFISLCFSISSNMNNTMMKDLCLPKESKKQIYPNKYTETPILTHRFLRWIIFQIGIRGRIRIPRNEPSSFSF